MGRPRVDPKLKRVDVKIRLPKYLVDEIDKLGSRTEVLEQAVKNYIAMKKV